MQKQKIRIRLKSYEISLLNESCEKIIDTASRTDSLTMGPIPLPTKRKIYCVLLNLLDVLKFDLFFTSLGYSEGIDSVPTH
jgi:ribosomal protein S10